ncbi:MAG: ATP-dependent helicase [Clostridiales bacterium]|nr:ATP-dependent helicase [Clostridiales bacterium]
MVETDKLVNFYIEQFREAYNREKSRTQMPKYVSRINAKAESMSRVHMHKGMEKQCEQLHGEVKRLAFAAYSGKNKEALKRLREDIFPDLVRIDLELFTEQEAELFDEDAIKGIRRDAHGMICNKPLAVLFHSWRAKNLRREIVSLVPSRPEMEFPEAMEMQRHFILHIGPTNSGKTYQSLSRLKNAQRGVYLGPLRLLALEVYETMKEYGVPCTMRPGQECIEEPESRVTSSTIEMLALDIHYDVAVIDEAQMVADEMRGHSWTRAILGVRADEVHVCMSPDAVPAVTHLIGLCNDDYETHYYERKTPLVVEDKPFVFPDDVQEGDALIAFSKKAVLDLAGRLEESGITSSVIYGSLPPEIRRRQTQMFYDGETKVVVSTDAIGMGLNLPVRRIVFMAAEKYDGRHQRALNVSEIKQIAGRAGRYGLYETGYVTALGSKRLHFLQKQIPLEIPQVKTVSLGFPQVLLSMDAPLDEILKLWKNEKPEPPFEKINIDEMLFL